MSSPRKPLGQRAPQLSTPSAGRLLAPVVGYVKRKSAQRQADMWNEVLRADPLHGPDSGYVVRVNDQKDPDGTWKLVWQPVSQDANSTGPDLRHPK